MDNSIIKFMIENKKSRAYSLIVQLYFDKIELHKTSIFKVWLSKELNISPDLIHDSSITAAMARYKKKQLTKPKAIASKEVKEKLENTNDFNTEIPDDFPGFR